MLQYAWFCNDVPNEIKSYNGLAISYFNLSDLRNSKYYHERSLHLMAEDPKNKLREIAVSEVKQHHSALVSESLIEAVHSVTTDQNGNLCKRTHVAISSFK
jgi:hypothetical protein